MNARQSKYEAAQQKNGTNSKQKCWIYDRNTVSATNSTYNSILISYTVWNTYQHQGFTYALEAKKFYVSIVCEPLLQEPSFFRASKFQTMLLEARFILRSFLEAKQRF